MRVKRKRPFGLMVILVLELLQLVTWGVFLYLLTIPELDIAVEEILDVSTLAYRIQIGSMLLLLIALPGLWLLQRWGWILLMIQTGISLSMGIWQFFEGNPNYAGMFVNIAIVFYLNQWDVQQLFIPRSRSKGIKRL
ncbi:hypothetical protein [Candidatus Leptofilum sp.]|uniref:hypothetical protein n=1 Tax=Candidatus Leptofilum sp. TaxID=3241576 RepID=UPI003B5B1668